MDVVFDLASQQIAMLKANLLRCAFEMHIRPSALIEFVGAVEAGV
jgi:hypothetical protein